MRLIDVLWENGISPVDLLYYLETRVQADREASTDREEFRDAETLASLIDQEILEDDYTKDHLPGTPSLSDN
jgi:hypothetical protein